MSVKDTPPRPEGAPVDSDQFLRWMDKLRFALNIDDHIAVTAPANADEVDIFSVADNARRKITLANLFPQGIVTVTGATHTVATSTKSLIANRGGTITVTLPSAATYTGRILHIKTIQGFTVVSASSNVVPIDSATAGTAILPATDGAWAMLHADGTNWVIMAASV